MAKSGYVTGHTRSGHRNQISVNGELLEAEALADRAGVGCELGSVDFVPGSHFVLVLDAVRFEVDHGVVSAGVPEYQIDGTADAGDRSCQTGAIPSGPVVAVELRLDRLSCFGGPTVDTEVDRYNPENRSGGLREAHERIRPCNFSSR